MVKVVASTHHNHQTLNPVTLILHKNKATNI